MTVSFDDRAGLGRTPVVGPSAHVALAPVPRVSGERTPTELDALDPVVTVALGSTPATILLGEDVALAGGVLALVLPVGLQSAITRPSLRSGRFRRFAEAEPAPLSHRGHVLDAASRAERATREEVPAVPRPDDVADPASVAAVVLETDGSFGVLDSDPEASTLRTVATRSPAARG